MARSGAQRPTAAKNALVKTVPNAKRYPVVDGHDPRARGQGRPSVLDKGWRPHKGEWQPGTPASLAITAVRRGASYKAACRRAGFSFQTLDNLRRRGRQSIDTTAAASDPHRMLSWEDFRLLIPYKDRIYADFLAALEMANAHAIVTVETEAFRDLPETPNMRRWWLAHRDPENWAERSEVALTGKIEHDHRHAVLVGILTNPELREAATRLGEQVALHAPDAVLGAQVEGPEPSLRAVE